MLTRDDLLNATLLYIIGACYEWEQHAQQFNGRPNDFVQFYLRTHNTCWRYCMGQKKLDGSCSDFECTTALNMMCAFKDNFIAIRDI
jgi:hypothetical protein